MKKMTYKLIPPTEDFFSRKWSNVYITQNVYLRIDSTRSKLTELESKLREMQSLDGRKYNPDLWAFLDRVSWLRSYIGLWTPGDEWNAEMVYPHAKQVMTQWNEKILGERKEEGHLLILLSPSVVDWLNEVDKWVSFPYLYTVSTTT